MATRQTPLYEFRNPHQKVLMGVEWDDVTLQVSAFVFRIDAGDRGATLTLTRTSDGMEREHDFLSGEALRWNPPFAMAMSLYTHPKSGTPGGLPNGWTAEMAFD